MEIEGTEFQKAVWQEISKIPLGETRTYKDISIAIGKPNSSRAVANACGQNHFPIIIPCHRVIGSNGSLAGFGGGVRLKKSLLDLEARNS